MRRAQDDVEVKSVPKRTLIRWASRVETEHASDRAVLLELAARSDARLMATPQQQWIAKAVRCCIRTVKNAVARLIKAGLIERKFRYDKRGKRCGCEYRLLPPWVTQTSTTMDHELRASVAPSEASTKGNHCPSTYVLGTEVVISQWEDRTEEVEEDWSDSGWARTQPPAWLAAGIDEVPL